MGEFSITPINEIPRKEPRFIGDFVPGEAGYEALAVCRECNQEITVSAQIEGDVLECMSTGGRRGCANPRCGDKFPAIVLSYWPVFCEVNDDAA